MFLTIAPQNSSSREPWKRCFLWFCSIEICCKI